MVLWMFVFLTGPMVHGVVVDVKIEGQDFFRQAVVAATPRPPSNQNRSAWEPGGCEGRW